MMKTVDLSQFPTLSKIEVATALKAAIYAGAYNKSNTILLLVHPDTIDYVCGLFDVDSRGAFILSSKYRIRVELPKYPEKENLTDCVLGHLAKFHQEQNSAKLIKQSKELLDSMLMKKRWYEFWK